MYSTASRQHCASRQELDTHGVPQCVWHVGALLHERLGGPKPVSSFPSLPRVGRRSKGVALAAEQPPPGLSHALANSGPRLG